METMATDARTYLATMVLNEERIVSYPSIGLSPGVNNTDRLLIEH